MKLSVGAQPKNILRKDVTLRNLVIKFGEMECKQVLEQKVAIYIRVEEPLKETEFSPGHNGSFTILQIWTDYQIRFQDSKGICVVKVMRRGDLTEFLPDETMEMLEMYVEEQMNSGQPFTVLDYKRSTSNRVNKGWGRK